MIRIRKENENDYSHVYNLVKGSFRAAEHSDGTEQDLVVRLRKSKAFLPDLSLVAVDDDDILGYILFSQLKLGQINAVALAPLAIHSNVQRRGIGTSLMQEGHRIAKELGYEWSVVLGSEHYYPRVGYRPASEFGIFAPFDVPEANFMALNLQGKSSKLNQTAEYAKEFFE